MAHRKNLISPGAAVRPLGNVRVAAVGAALAATVDVLVLARCQGAVAVGRGLCCADEAEGKEEGVEELHVGLSESWRQDPRSG